MHLFRYVSSDLATDVTINVGEVKFFLHKVCLFVFLKCENIDFLELASGMFCYTCDKMSSGRIV